MSTDRHNFARLFRAVGPQSPTTGLWLGLALAMIVLAWTFTTRASLLLAASPGVERAVVADVFGMASLQWQLAFYLLALLFLYATLGAAAWALACLTERALPAWTGRRHWLVAAWVAACVVWTSLADAATFRWSTSGGNWPWVRANLVASVSVFDLATVLFLGAIGFVLALAIARHPSRRMILRVGIWAALAIGAFAVLLNLPLSQARMATGETKPPDVIVIGIDSLRADVVTGGTGWYTPNLSGFLRDSQLLPDTTTPMARTFPSWIATLTGRHPVSTNARENLVPRRALKVDDSLQARLRAAGYRAIYATDEVRFSNIDASYGFDEVIGPRMGVSDLVLGTLNDIPLANLVANTALGAVLFPDTHANRAAAATYDPHTFIEQLGRRLELQGPTFLAVHLTLPHWPLRWANAENDPFADDMAAPYPYLASVVAADRQFGELMSLLERRGALDDAVVVLLSDHGEGLGLTQDNLLAGKEARAAAGPMRVAMWGHGTSVLSPHQYSVLLAFRGYGLAQRRLSHSASHGAVPASLEDVAPTVLDLLGMPADGGFDGISLAPVLRGRVAETAFADRVRFTESAYTPRALARGNAEARELVAEGIDMFAVNRESGRVEARMERWPALLAAKERAAIRGDWILAAVPGEHAGEHTYVLASRSGGLPRRLAAEPDGTADPIAAALWSALQNRFPGELGSPAPPPRSGDTR